MKSYLVYKVKKLKRYFRQFEQTSLIKISVGFILGCILYNNAFLITLILLLTIILSKFRVNLFFIFLIIGITYTSIYLSNNSYEIQNNRDKEAEISGWIIEESEQKEFNQQIVLQTNFKSLVTSNVSKYPKLNYGDEIKLKGKLTELEESNFSNYLKAKNIYLELKNPILIKSNSNTLLSSIFKFKQNIVEIINSKTSEPQSSLISGILVGTKSSLDKDIKEDLQNTGLTHIISVSGYNFTIIFTFLLYLSNYLNRRLLLYLSIPTMFLYLLIVGITNLPALRAMFMILFIVIGQILGRRHNIYLILFLSLALILIEYPLYWQNISLQLSFGATIGLFIIADKFKRMLSKLPDSINEIVSATLGVLVITTPITIFIFDKFSLVSILSNLIVLPLIPLATLLSIAGLTLSFIRFDFLSNSIFYILNSSMKFTLSIINKLSTFEFSTTSNKYLVLIIILILIAIILIHDYFIFKKHEKHS